MHIHTSTNTYTQSGTHTNTLARTCAYTCTHTHVIGLLVEWDCTAKSTSNDIPSRFRFCIGGGSYEEGGDSGWEWFN